MLRGMSKVCQERYAKKGVSKVCQGYVKGMSRTVCQGYVKKGVSMVCEQLHALWRHYYHAVFLHLYLGYCYSTRDKDFLLAKGRFLGICMWGRWGVWVGWVRSDGYKHIPLIFQILVYIYIPHILIPLYPEFHRLEAPFSFAHLYEKVFGATPGG